MNLLIVMGSETVPVKLGLISRYLKPGIKYGLSFNWIIHSCLAIFYLSILMFSGLLVIKVS